MSLSLWLLVSRVYIKHICEIHHQLCCWCTSKLKHPSACMLYIQMNLFRRCTSYFVTVYLEDFHIYCYYSLIQYILPSMILLTVFVTVINSVVTGCLISLSVSFVWYLCVICLAPVLNFI